MHIPSSMLNGSVCPVTATMAAVGVGLAGYYAVKTKEVLSISKFAAVTSLIFALQMLNFPVQNGTSGHLIGGMLAVSLLGIPLAVLSMAIVLVVQTVFFADGGMNALGANVLNMSLITAGVGGFLFHRALAKGMNKKIALGTASFISVLLAAAACSFEVAMAKTAAIGQVLPSMLSVHALIGIGEGLLTVAVFSVLVSLESFFKKKEKAVVLGAMGAAVLGAFFSPLASSFPDGLEWVAGKLAFKEFAAFEFPSLFPDYQALFTAHPSLATVSAGMIGIGIVFLFAWALGAVIKTRKIALV